MIHPVAHDIRRTARAFGCLVVAGFVTVSVSHHSVAAEDDNSSGGGPLAEFYSYLPAAPDLKLPELSIPFWTDDLKKARRAYKSGNYEKAVKLFRRSSDDGNLVADWYLCHI